VSVCFFFLLQPILSVLKLMLFCSLRFVHYTMIHIQVFSFTSDAC
jgi:hypothetical protein